MSLCTIACTRQKIPNTLSEKAIFLQYRKTNDSLYIGSGFLLVRDTTYYLITADHNIRDAYFGSIIIYYKYDGIYNPVPIYRISEDSISSIRVSYFYDLAAIILMVPPAGKLKFNKIAVPIEQVSADTNIVKKGLTAIGYGFNDFSTIDLFKVIPQEKIDSTVVDNGITELPRFDTYLKSKFFVLKDSNYKGMSGGPVFIADTKGLVNDSSKLVGIFHGYFADKGIWYTSITPLTELNQLINSFRKNR